MVPHLNYIKILLPEKNEAPITLCCQLCSTRYTVVQIKNCLKSTAAIKVAIMYIVQWKVSHATIKLTVSKDEWNTKEGTGNMKNVLYILHYAKRYLSG